VENCVFCQIISGEIPTEFIYQDEKVAVFKDVHPSAPVHVLVIPKEHIESLNDTNDKLLLGEILTRLVLTAKELGLKDSGYKVAINVGKGGGQLVPHLHFHLLGGWKDSEGGVN
jgi:histidine triad (HIT) family protein